MRKALIGLVAAAAAIGLGSVALTSAARVEAPVEAAVVAHQAVPADQVAASFGWVTHLSYNDKNYGDFDRTLAKMNELGVRAVRGGIPDNDDLKAKYRALCDNGIRLTLTVPYRVDFDDMVNYLRSIGGSGCVDSVTGLNEPDLFYEGNGMTAENWPQLTREFQDRLFGVINAHPDLAGITVAGASPAFDHGALDLGDSFDVCDLHPYGSYLGLTRDDGYSNIYSQLERNAGFCKGRPTIATEVGYHTALQYDTSSDKHFPTSERAMALMMPKAVVSYFNAGLVRHFNYELHDEGTGDPRDKEGSFGIIRSDWSNKPAFDNMRRLAAFLGDRGTSFQPGTLAYGVTGDTNRIETLLMQRSDGTFVLAVQSNEPVWQSGDEGLFDLDPPVRDIRIQFGAAADVTVRELDRDDPVRTENGVDGIDLSIGAEVVLLEVRGAGGPPTVDPPVDTPVDPPVEAPTDAPTEEPVVTDPGSGTAAGCLELESGSVAGHDPASWVRPAVCDGGSAQQWVRDGDLIRSADNTHCLDVQWSGTDVGATVWAWECNGSGAQQWQQREDGSLVNPASGKCLDVAAGDAARTALAECATVASQRWARVG